MAEKEITVVSDNHDCFSVPVSATLEPGADFAHIKLVDVASGNSVHCQCEKSDGKVLLSWIIDELEMGQTKKYKAVFGEEGGLETTGVRRSRLSTAISMVFSGSSRDLEHAKTSIMISYTVTIGCPAGWGTGRRIAGISPMFSCFIRLVR